MSVVAHPTARHKSFYMCLPLLIRACPLDLRILMPSMLVTVLGQLDKRMMK